MTTRNIRRAAGAAALALAALTLAACACCAPSPYDTAAGQPAPASALPSAAGSQAASGLTVTTIDQTTLTVPNARPAVLFFFTVGCGECETGGQALAQARQQAAGKADFLLVDLDPSEPRQAIDYFRQAVGDPAIPVVTTGTADLAQRWKVTQLSTAIVIDTTGTVAWRAIDPAAQDLLTAIDKATR